MKAVIMAGGEGTRLRPLTCDKPKPMVNMINKPVMEHIINLLKKHGIYEMAVTLHYVPNAIIDYFGDGDKFGVKMRCYVENMPLGTAGSVKNVMDFVNGEDFLVISGDSLTDINLSNVIKFHNNNKSIATIVLHKAETPLDYGVVVVDSLGRIVRFVEKPDWNEVISDNINTGIYALNPSIFNEFGQHEFYDFARDLFPKLLEKGLPLYGFISDGYWCDIGDVESYIKAHVDILNGKTNIDLGITEVDGAYVEKGSLIENGAIVESPVYLSAGAHICEGAHVGAYSIIGKNTLIKDGASVKRGIVGNGVRLAPNCSIRGAIICDKVRVEERASVFENTIIGAETHIGAGTNVAPDVKIWPCKKLEPASYVKENLVWGGKTSRRIFHDGVIEGEINVDITPEFAAKVGSVFASALKYEKIGIGYDSHPSNEMLSAALRAGLSSSGAKVYDFAFQPLPITRSAVRFYGLNGGIHLSVSKKNKNYKLNIEFLDKNGANIQKEIERKIEAAFARDEFVRCEVQDLKKIMSLKNYKYYYLRDIVNNIKSEKFVKNFLIETTSETVAELTSNLTNEISPRIFNKHLPYEFRALISDNGEDITLLSRDGAKISGESYLMLVALITLNKVPNATIVVPVSVSKKMESLVSNLGGRLVYSKTSKNDFMNEILRVGVSEQFKLCFDGIYASIRILDFINQNNVTFTEIMEKIPEFYKIETNVECSNKNKAKIINELLKQYKNEKCETIEGIKVHTDNGWVLVIPNSKRSGCKIIAEGFNYEIAKELSGIFTDKIKTLDKN